MSASRPTRTHRAVRARRTAAVDQLYGAALRMTRNPADAEDPSRDLHQGVLGVLVLPRRHQPQKAWLHRILTNTYINSYRKKQRQPSAVP